MKKKIKQNNILYRILRPILKIIFVIFMKPTIVHKENILDTGFLYAGTHVSYFDAFIMGYTTKKCVHFLAKIELFKSKIGSYFFKSMGAIPVDRKRKNDDAKNEAINLLKNDNIVCIFPEGTINKTKNDIMPFKYGAVSIAYKANKPIIPFAIVGKPKIFNYKTKIVIGKPFYVKSDDFKNETENLENIVKNLIMEGKSERKS